MFVIAVPAAKMPKATKVGERPVAACLFEMITRSCRAEHAFLLRHRWLSRLLQNPSAVSPTSKFTAPDFQRLAQAFGPAFAKACRCAMMISPVPVLCR
jgi:hypothetical protein